MLYLYIIKQTQITQAMKLTTDNIQAVAPLFARRARRALSAFDFKGRKLEQLTEIAEKGYIERNGVYYTISTGGKLLPDCKKSDVKIIIFRI